MDQASYSNAARILTESLHLHQPPVAISFTDSVPTGLGGHTGRVPAGCRFWEDAAASAFATTAGDHNLCAVGVYTHNLQPSPGQQTDLMDALKVFADLGYVRQEDIPTIPVLQSQSKFVVYAPLMQATLSPDVVLLFVRADQMLILSEAVQQVENASAPAMGRPACAVVPQVVNTGRAAVSLGCCGARAYLNALKEDTAIFAIPGAKLEAYVERVQALASANTVLTKFHQMRRRDVEAGKSPTVKESLAVMG
jgi:uncharacterized protein (DUF169 family)